jgi:hypothetical protein
MARAYVIWNVEHDAAIIKWERRPNDFPLDPINNVLAKMYNMGDNFPYPYLYEAYQYDTALGLLVMGGAELSGDEITALFCQISDTNNVAPQVGEFEPQEFNV